MEEFLKIKAEELDYLIEEREKFDKKEKLTEEDKENLEAISNLIKDLSKQLSDNNVNETAKDIYEWTETRDNLDNKNNQTLDDKENIKAINMLLKELSSKLKEMSNRKSIDEYEAELENSQIELEKLQTKLNNLNLIEESNVESAAQDISKKIESLTKNILYNKRILDAYKILAENIDKFRTFTRIEFLKKEIESGSLSYQRKRELASLNSYLSPEDKILIEKCIKILPENLQQEVLKDDNLKNTMDSNPLNISQEQSINSERLNTDSPRMNSIKTENKPISSFNDDLNAALNKAIKNLHGIDTSNDEVVTKFGTIYQKNLQNAANQQQGKDEAYVEMIKNVLNPNVSDQKSHQTPEPEIQTEANQQQGKDEAYVEMIKNTLNPNASDQKSHQTPEPEIQTEANQQQGKDGAYEEMIKNALNPNASDQKSHQTPEPEIQIEENQSVGKNQENQSTTNNLESSEQHKKKHKKESKKSKEVTSVRKPKKNIFKRLIAKISPLAVALVLAIAGGSSIAKKLVTPKIDTAIENNTDELDNLSDNQITYSNGDEIYHPELLTDEEIKSLTNSEDSDVDLVDMQPITEPLNEKNNYSSNNDGFLINDSSSGIDSSEYDDTNLYTENDSSNLTYLDDDVETYTSYEANEYNNLNENSIRIGSEVTVDGNIHDDEYDAYYNENGQTLYYGTEPKRVVIGTGIVNNDGMNVIYAYNPDANQKIDELLNKGGEMVSILTANKEKYLQNYDGSTTLTPEEIKAYAEGWYNINDVSINNVKGLSR